MSKEKEKTLPLYELDLDDINFDAITAISIVDYPAIEKNFMAFAEEVKQSFEFANTDTDKRIITGPALIPDKKIYRRDRVRGEYDVYFSKEAIEKISLQFFTDYKQKSITLQHESNANDIVVFESWIINDAKNDKAKSLGFDLPEGTWMVSMKVNNDTVWELIKNETVKGFSIEAFLSQTLIKASADIKTPEEEIMEKIIEILKKVE